MIEDASINITNPILEDIMTEQKTSNYENMTEAELLEVLNNKDALLDTLREQVENLEAQIEALQNGTGRKAQVLEILKEHSPITIVAIAERLGISTKNVSSQLTYLRQEGQNICTDVNGKKFLV